MARLPLPLLFALLLFLLPSTLQQFTPDQRWLVPDGSEADMSTTWNNGDSITLSWASLNSSICDLWLTSRNTNNSYAVRLGTNIEVANAGTFPWTISVGNEQIQTDDQFVLRFIPTGSVYEGAFQFVQIPSPGFVVLAKGAATPTATTGASTASNVISTSSFAVSSETSAGTAASATSTSGPTALNPPPPSGGRGGLSTGVKVGAALAAIVALCVIIALLLWVVRLRRRVKAASNRRSQGLIPDKKSKLTKAPLSPDVDVEMTPHEKRISGLHEVQGDKNQPQEMSTLKERKSVYEMLG